MPSRRNRNAQRQANTSNIYTQVYARGNNPFASPPAGTPPFQPTADSFQSGSLHSASHEQLVDVDDISAEMDSESDLSAAPERSPRSTDADQLYALERKVIPSPDPAYNVDVGILEHLPDNRFDQTRLLNDDTALFGDTGFQPDSAPEAFDDPYPPSSLDESPSTHSEEDGYHPDIDDAGHTRSPVLAREPTMLENFSRSVRNYVPSSIPIPTALPSPPRVSRPVSFGSFMTPTGTLKVPKSNTGARGRRRESAMSAFYVDNTDWRANNDRGRERAPVDQGVFYSDEEMTGVTSYPRMDEGDPILWARWDTLQEVTSNALPRRFLLLGYASGLQIWDCTNLGSVFELLNLAGSEWGRISHAAVIPQPHARFTADDGLRSGRPLLGILTRIHDETTLLFYSLRRHRVVKRLVFPGLVTFLSNKEFIVISTANPPILHIISSVTLDTLFTVPSASLLPFAHVHSSVNKAQTNQTNVLPSFNLDTSPSSPQHPAPVFALSHRLLAYASSPPAPSSPTHASARRPRARSPSGGGLSNTFGMSNITQAELSSAALKVGGTVLSGMLTLGGMAYSAARSSAGLGGTESSPSATASSTASSPAQGLAALPGAVGGLANRFFSRSAPAATVHDDRSRRYSSTSAGAPLPRQGTEGGLSLPDHVPPILPHKSPALPEAGYYVTVIDLSRLSTGAHGTTAPSIVSEFLATRTQPISDLAFSDDGTAVVVCPRDGQLLQVFQLRPSPLMAKRGMSPSSRRATEGTRSSSRPALSIGQDPPLHVYDLRRGRTSAVIEGLDWTRDGRWLAIGTRKRTIHIFPLNPYGGKPDPRSHMEGHVTNPSQLQPLSTEVAPVVRLRVHKMPAPEQVHVPLAFAFVGSPAALPANLLPSARAPSVGSASSASDAGREAPSPQTPARAANYEDILVFDPTDGMLSLRRFTLELRHRDQGIGAVSLGGASLSLPGSVASGRLGTSPSESSRSGDSRPSGLTQMMEPPTELHARENTVATWSLQRRRDWGEIKRVVEINVREPETPKASTEGDWLSHAELSTCSRSPRVLPRSIYLSHQFSFHTLGEDYHALIRRYQFDISGTKLTVRRAVEVSAYSAGVGESFVEGFAAPRDIRRSSTSFDGPLASALGAGLDYALPPAVLPMLPNGAPGSKPKSFRSAIPIGRMAGFGDGMSESLGRIRREMHKARSPPRAGAAGQPGSVPLEFDEEDEDFLAPVPAGEDELTALRVTSRGASVSTPATSTHPLDDDGADGGANLEEAGEVGDDAWLGWDSEDKQAVEDAERFDDISAVGFMDEDQPPVVAPTKTKTRGRRRG